MGHGGQISSTFRTNSNVTPSSQSECSLDRQSNQSTEFFTNQQTATATTGSKKRVNIKKPSTPTYEGLESGDTSIFNADMDDCNEESRSRYMTMTGKY